MLIFIDIKLIPLKDIVKSTWIVGQNSSDHSLTIHEQEGRLKKFREGLIFLFLLSNFIEYSRGM
jgi:hypothetical protein